MSKNLPSFVLVGTAKAGTTSLFHYLKQHSQLCIPVKETFYFLKEIYRNHQLSYPQQRAVNQLILSEDHYDRLYAECEPKITGEIGTGYLYHYETSVPEIKKKLGSEVKILIILRNPIDRTYSSYKHFAKDLHETLSFEESLKAENERIKAGWDFMWHHKSVGLYCNQVKAYLTQFKHVKILFHRDLQHNPMQVLNEVYQFLGIDEDFGVNLDKKHNPSGEPRIPWLQKMITHETPAKKVLRPFFRFFYNSEKREKIRKSIKSKNLNSGKPMASKTREYLIDFFRTDIQNLEKLIDKDLSHWYSS